METKKIWKILSNFITGVLFLLLIFMIFVVVSSKASGGEPNFLGYQLKTVLSGSMEPTFMTGSIIAVKPIKDPNNLKKGDVITFKISDDAIATHRIVDVLKNGEHVLYKTKGDNNPSVDGEPTLAQNVVAKYTGFTIPYVGFFTNYAKSKNGTALLLILPGLLLIAYSSLTIYKAFKEIDKTSKNSDVQETI